MSTHLDIALALRKEGKRQRELSKSFHPEVDWYLSALHEGIADALDRVVSNLGYPHV